MLGPSQALIDSFKKPVPSNPLKRNEACHQCRKRKLKCDARRPCSTCLRSHAYLVNHTPKGVAPPPYPDCSYDEGFNEGDIDKDEECQKLERRIQELEGLLQGMAIELETTRAVRDTSGSPSNSSGAASQASYAPSPAAVFAAEPSQRQISPPAFATQAVSSSTDAVDTQMFGDDLNWLNMMQENVLNHASFPGTNTNGTAQTDLSYGAIRDDLGLRINHSISHNMINVLRPDADPALDAAFMGTDFVEYLATTSTPSYGGANGTALSTYGSTTFDFQDYAVVQTGWSPHLPTPSLTRRLVQAFFAFHIHAGRLFHGPTFLASLDLHPFHERYPSVAVLHALCAIGSLFMGEIAPTPIHTDRGFPYVIFHGKWRRVAARPDSFAEQQAKLAQQGINQFFDAGEGFVPGWQAQILLLWFYMSQARWSETFMTSGRTLRSTVPLGINTMAPFKIPSRGPANPGPIIQEAAILPPAENSTEEETRRNIFWLAYAAERAQSASSTFALELDDGDICQLLPVRGDQFDLGIQVPVENRQWCNEKDVLLNHPLSQTDSFVLYIKSTMVLSRVKTFNVRYKSRYLSGDPALFPRSGKVPTTLDTFDPRDTPAFIEVDRLVTSFRPSFPPQYRMAIQDETVDPHLYSALTAAHMSVILLHDPHMDMHNPMCPSRNRVLHAARSILDLIYLMSSTTYDVSLLDLLSISGWYFAARALIRFLHAALHGNFMDPVSTLQAEITYIHSTLAKAGERMPAAYRYKRVLYDVLLRTCGEQFVETPAASPPSAYISAVDASYVETSLINPAHGGYMEVVSDKADTVVPSTDY